MRTLLVAAAAASLGTTTAFAYQVPADHPRVMVNKGMLAELAGRATGPLASDYKVVKDRADAAVKSGSRYINNQWSCPVDLLHLGLAFLVERELGHDHKKYADAAARDMKKWLKPKGGSCHFGFHGICYDWVYDGLSEADRRDLGNRLGSWLTWYTNSPTIKLKYGHWEYNQTWGVNHQNTMHARDAISQKTFIALAIHGAPTDFGGQAKQWLDSCNKRIPAECVPAFDRMGGVWAESAGHGGYGPIKIPAWTFEAWHTGMGVDWYKLMKPWSYFPEETAWITFLMLPYNDRTARIDDNGGGSIGGYSDAAPILARAFRDPVAAYWSNRAISDGWVNKYTPNNWLRLIALPTDLKPLSPKQAGYPRAWYFRGAGQVYMRGAWDDPNSTWAFFGVGPHMAGHQHDDEGHFLIARRGNLVGKGGGKGGGNDADHYWGGSLVFNILTIYDKDEKFRRNRKNENDGGLKRLVYTGGRTERGSIASYRHSDDCTYSAGDLTKAYKPHKVREVTRQILYLRGPQEFFVVFDRVEATKGSFPKHFMLHAASEPKVSGAETVKTAGHVSEHRGEGVISTWESSTEGEKGVKSTGKSRVFMQTLLPAGAVVTKRGGKGHEHWGHPLEPSGQYNHTGKGRDQPPVIPWRLEVAAPVGTARQYFCHVFFVTDGDGPMPATTASVAGNAVTVKIDGAPRKYEITFASSGATSARVSCKGQGAYDAALAGGFDFSAQEAVEKARARGGAATKPKSSTRSEPAPGGERMKPPKANDPRKEILSRAAQMSRKGDHEGALKLIQPLVQQKGLVGLHAFELATYLKRKISEEKDLTPEQRKARRDAAASGRKARQLWNLAEAMLRAENYEQARSHYERLIRDFPGSSYARRARERLDEID